MSRPNSPNGITIVADAPECNNAMLNVKRPAVLRQYYGMNIGEKVGHGITRVAYRSHLATGSEGSDPFRLTIKPFSIEIELMSKYVNKLLRVNCKEFQLQSADLSKPFNSCTVLLYHTLMGVKKESSMGWHCDSKYSLSGSFNQNSNGQTYNTVVVIFTVGEERFLQWRKRMTKINENGRKYYEVCPNFEATSVLESGSICILNPRDKIPHYDLAHG